jgi:hypothetical protein
MSSQPDTAAASGRWWPTAGLLSHFRTWEIKNRICLFPKYVAMAGLGSCVQQQVEQHATAAYEQLVHLHESLAAAETTTEAAAAVAISNHQPDAVAAAQQLNSMAQAVASRIPLSTACNNSGCSNLAQRSELVLVGGKSCVCARCKAAR